MGFVSSSMPATKQWWFCFVLEATLVLLTAQVPVLEATLVLLTAQVPVEGVIVARWTGCSSKLCLLFDPLQPRSLQQTRCPCRLSSAQISTADKVSLSFVRFEPRSLQQRRMHKNYNFGTSMNNIVDCL